MTTNPAGDLMRLINGYQISQAIHVAAVLGITDQLKDGPRSADELAAATGTQARSLYRLLRALAAIGVLHEDADARFALTPMGDCLRSDAAASVAPWAAFIGRPAPRRRHRLRPRHDESHPGRRRGGRRRL